MLIKSILSPALSYFKPALNNLNIKPFLTTSIIYSYHMSYLMDSKYDYRFVKIDKRAFHLYKQAIMQSEFHQKKYLIVLIDCVRTKQKYEDFENLVEFGIQNLNKFTEPLSIFSFSTQLYLYNYPNRQKCQKLARKGFEFMKEVVDNKKQLKISSYHTMKFLIFIQKNVGLGRFTDKEYGLINFERFKPLFHCFTLQIFYQNNLQHYETVQKVFEMFLESQKIIPFADMHHFRLTVKKIKDEKYQLFINKVYDRLIQKSNQNNQKNLKNQQLNIKINTNGKQQCKQQEKINWNAIYRQSIQRRNTTTAFDL